MPRAFSYVRFSRIEQKNGDSRRRQREGVIALAAKLGLEIDDSLQYTDEGVSGYRGQHTETGQLGVFLGAIKEGFVKPGDYLFIENLDRLSRQTATDAMTLLNEICRTGVIVATVTDGRIYSRETLIEDPTALLIAVISFMRANDESRVKAGRLRSAWANKRAGMKDKPLTGRTPAWIKIVDGGLALRDDRSAIVKNIYDWYSAGMGQHSIAEKLNNEGVATWGSGKQSAARWHTSYIVKILDSRAVIGEFTPHTLEYDGTKKRREPLPAIKNYFPPAIDEETFSRVRELRDGNKANGRKGKQPLLNLFSGVMRCTHCGSTVTRVSKNKEKSWVYLCCVAAKHGATVETGFRFCAGGYGAVRYSLVEDVFIDAVLAGKFLVQCDKEKIDDLQTKIKEAMARKESAMFRAANLIEGIKDGTLKGSTVLIEKVPRADNSVLDWTVAEDIQLEHVTAAENEKEISALFTKCQTLRPLIIDKKLNELRAALLINPINREQANAALRALCEKMTIDDEGLRVTFKHSEQVLTIPLPGGKA